MQASDINSLLPSSSHSSFPVAIQWYWLSDHGNWIAFEPAVNQQEKQFQQLEQQEKPLSPQDKVMHCSSHVNFFY